jgi:sugar-specific transcriptional regulator TrmB
MSSVVEKLLQLGLTTYEAKAYTAVLNTHLCTATQASEKSGVPRTRIYQVLESLQHKGWVRVYSGVPLLFKAVDPTIVFEKVKEDYAELLENIKTTLKNEVNDMKEKIIIKKFDMGLEGLKQEIQKAKTVQINNATNAFIKKIHNAFNPKAVVKILLFPGETKPKAPSNVEFQQAEVAIVSIVRNKEVPSASIILDENRTFTAFQDPVNNKYIVDEMLYDECNQCFAGWSTMSWNSNNQTPR